MGHHEEWFLLSAYLDGELAVDERSRVETHLGSCRPCRLELDGLRRVKDLAARQPRRDMPADLMGHIEGRLGSRPSVLRALRAGLRRAARLAPAGALAALALWSTLSVLRPPAPEPHPLELLIASHARYAAEGLAPTGDLASSRFSAQLASYYEDE